ncbi:hypothetical protein EDD85DRAFT_80558 [Armillaria nabsnona]|nr:hypothetical protein EDD85DRAFT_80558 [Armillaria nabsnona]
MCELPHDDGFGLCENCLRLPLFWSIDTFVLLHAECFGIYAGVKGEIRNRRRGGRRRRIADLRSYRAGYPPAPFPQSFTFRVWLLRLPSPLDSVYPPTYMLHITQRVGPRSCLCCQLSVEDPLNGYTYTRVPRVFVHLIPSLSDSDEFGLALDARLAAD